MDNEGEHVNIAFLFSNIVDSDFGVRDTSVVAGFGVGLSSAAPVASSWSSTHCCHKKKLKIIN